MSNCYQTRVLNAPIQKVWDVIKNFHDVSWTPNVVSTCKKVGEINGETVGAKRVLNDTFEETLLKTDEKNYSFSYSIDEAKDSPVSSINVKNYIGIVKLIPITQTDETFIEWKSSWDSDTKESEEFCHTIYVSMMADLNITLKDRSI